MKTNFRGFLRQNSGLYFKKITALASAQRSGMGHKVLVWGQGAAQGLCVCVTSLAENPRTPRPPSGCWLQPSLRFQPSTGTEGCPWPCCIAQPLQHPRQQRRAGGTALPGASAGTAALLLSKWTGDGGWLLSLFSLALVSPRFCAGCIKMRQKLVVPLWHFKIYFCYTWFSVKSRHLCRFVMEVIPSSASTPAKIFSKWLRSHS